MIKGTSIIPLSELMMSLTMALDITEGQPPEHSIRCCWIGMHIGEKIGLDEDHLFELFFVLLLKDAGCSSNAARICKLYMTDDLAFKKEFKTVGPGLSSAVKFVIKNAGSGQNWINRVSTILDTLKNGPDYAQELIETRCTKGADIVRELRFSENTAQGVHSLDEHWDGSGKPNNLQGQEIPLYSRIALLAQVIDVFQVEHEMDTALNEINARSTFWFDPKLVKAFMDVAKQPEFLQGLKSEKISERVMQMAPAQTGIEIDDDYFDCIIKAFGGIVDSKSPYTAGHSERVAQYADLIAERLGISTDERKWLRRAALLHDLGKLGVSNSILDKPGSLDEDEWMEVKKHAELSEQILHQITPFQELAKIAGAHHEKLDGTGYPRGISGEYISIMTRIITTADIFDAITAERPYRGAIPVLETLEIMEKSLHTSIDPACFDALKQVVLAPVDLKPILSNASL